MALINECMAAATLDFGILGVEKDNQNSFQKFNYRSIDGLLMGLNKVLAKNGIHMIHTVQVPVIKILGQDAKGVNIFYLEMGLEVTFCAKDGSRETASIFGGNDGKDVSKLTGQLTSYLLKELCFKQFSIPTSGADDIDSRDSNGIPMSFMPQPNKKGVVWQEPDFSGGIPTCLAWAALMTGKSVADMEAVMDKTTPDANGKKSGAFVKTIREMWSA